MPNLKLENFNATFEKTSICKLVFLVFLVKYGIEYNDFSAAENARIKRTGDFTEH